MTVYECSACFELLDEPGYCPTCGTLVGEGSMKEMDVEPGNVMTLEGYYLNGSHPEDEE